MAPRTNPTLRQRRLGAELRRMREQAGFGGTELGRLVGMSPAQVTQMEAGKIGISVERLRTVAATCMCVNEPLIAALSDVITEREKPGWWEDYRGTLSSDFIDVAEFEGQARSLTTYTMAFVPGLLQTGPYAAAVFAQTFPPLPRHEIDLRTAFRMQRQRLVRSGATPYSAFIHEAALRMQFSGPAVLAEQLGALIEDSRQPTISVRVVPFDIGAMPSSSENFTYAEGPVPELDGAQVDSSLGIRIVDAPAHMAKFRSLLARFESGALSEEESRDFIGTIKKETESKRE
ncbi:helix-turn-helix domain-containing protein [Kitasatospora sp. NPDC057542]|uniref:helix-turn-helix domain-containing protein n=1 Tax=Streptomycetaceae TaxID=2062 RepID=UPI001CCD2B80|nr:helix-turn-helix transcriptional regulator [Streptomyces sp. LS1784]